MQLFFPFKSFNQHPVTCFVIAAGTKTECAHLTCSILERSIKGSLGPSSKIGFDLPN